MHDILLSENKKTYFGKNYQSEPQVCILYFPLVKAKTRAIQSKYYFFSPLSILKVCSESGGGKGFACA